ncbi:Proteasome subunit beta type-7 [Saxophila tyrrhenica]|uniref:Proteasome subunit beta n=1 Tax=Saxophila tyrrhenica TaxID=1690608 RepID=A0AAV9PL91_9PEZI|nr:Proteasome subunit beta type-7 [Saxophila tyrrhenica]
MNHFPEAWGRPRDDIYGSYNASYLPQSRGGLQSHHQPTTHTQQPIVTGTSVLALKFSTGVVIAADNLASYGSLARFTDVHRLKPFNKRAVVGFGGDVSDMQYLDRLLNSLDVEENYTSPTGDAKSDDDRALVDAPLMSAKNLHTYLAKVMYKRRTDFNPLWNALLVCGLDEKDQPFLASADLLGTTFSAPSMATGFGAHLAQPLLRRVAPDEAATQELSKEKAVEAIKECMKVLFYRDARSMNEYSVAVIDQSGVELKEDEKLENQSWAFADRIKGYGTQTV